MNVYGNRRTVVFIVVLLMVSNIAWGGEVWHYWSTWSATHKLTPKSSISALVEADFRDQMSDDYVYFAYLTYSRAIGNGFGILAEGYWEWAESAAKNWTETNSVVPGLTYTTGTPRSWQIKLQDRFFYRYNVNPKMDYHRPRMTLTRDLGPVTLVLSDEMRVDLSGDRRYNFFRNRIYATLVRKISPKLSVGLGIARQSDRKDGGWTSFNILQTVVNYTF